MNFFNLLTNDEVLDLVNECIEEKNIQEDWDKTELAEVVTINDEEDRKDENGVRYVWVRAYNRKHGFIKHITSYNFYDFEVKAALYKPGILDNTLRCFMTRRFGEKYISALYNYRLAKIQAESEMLMEELENSRK